MWWIAFTAIDLYVGLIILEAMAPSLPAQKLKRVRLARNVVIALLIITMIAFFTVLMKRWLGHL